MDAPVPQVVDALAEAGVPGKCWVDVGCDHDGNVQAEALGQETECDRIVDADGELVHGVEGGRGNQDEGGRWPGGRRLLVVEPNGIVDELRDTSDVEEFGSLGRGGHANRPTGGPGKGQKRWNLSGGTSPADDEVDDRWAQEAWSASSRSLRLGLSRWGVALRRQPQPERPRRRAPRLL